MAVGVLRGGAPLALMVSHAIGVPVAFLRYERATRNAMWDSSLPIPPRGTKMLLCEDIAGRGFTMADCTAFLEQHGLIVKTLTAAYDELSRVRPDYGFNAVGYFALLPWERHAHTERYRSDWDRTAVAKQDRMAQDHEYAAYAIDLDGILLPDLPLARYDEDLPAALNERDLLLPFETLPGIEIRAVRAIVTGRPQIDRDRTQAWLDRHGFSGLTLVMREPGHHPEGPEGAAAHKASAVRALGATHFIESDPAQAILISQLAPLLRVIWWDAPARRGMLVNASNWR